eukprot:Polyplicarium_translucidae@DN3336_c0_g2_i10.p1
MGKLLFWTAALLASAVAHDHDHDDDDEHEDAGGDGALLGSKIGSIFVNLAVAVLGCALPMALVSCTKTAKYFSYVLAGAGGAFLGLAVLHLFSEADAILRHEGFGMTFGDSFYNACFCLIALGFVVVLFLDKVFWISSSEPVKMSHSIDIAHGPPEPPTVADPVPKSSPDGETAGGEQQDFINLVEDQEGMDCHRSNSVASSKHSSLSCAALVISLTTHGIFEGLVVGLTEDIGAVWVATVSICAHEWAVAFALTVTLMRAGLKGSIFWIFLAVFVMSTPIGIAAGMGVNTSSELAAGICNAIAAGAIIYLGAQMAMEEFDKAPVGWRRVLMFLAFVAGIGVVFGFTVLHLANSHHAH